MSYFLLNGKRLYSHNPIKVGPPWPKELQAKVLSQPNKRALAQQLTQLDTAPHFRVSSAPQKQFIKQLKQTIAQQTKEIDFFAKDLKENRADLKPALGLSLPDWRKHIADNYNHLITQLENNKQVLKERLGFIIAERNTYTNTMRQQFAQWRYHNAPHTLNGYEAHYLKQIGYTLPPSEVRRLTWLRNTKPSHLTLKGATYLEQWGALEGLKTKVLNNQRRLQPPLSTQLQNTLDAAAPVNITDTYGTLNHTAPLTPAEIKLACQLGWLIPLKN
jgi:hypothetical protein